MYIRIQLKESSVRNMKLCSSRKLVLFNVKIPYMLLGIICHADGDFA